MTERDGQIANLNQALTERDGQIASLNNAVTEHDRQVHSQGQRIQALLQSHSWKWTKPLRLVASYVLSGIRPLRIALNRSSTRLPIFRQISIRRIRHSPLFDQAFYALKNPDVRMAGVDPAMHYFLSGWKEHRDPSEHFCTRLYLQNHPDVAAAGINPLLHYINYGQMEGRKISAPKDFFHNKMPPSNELGYGEVLDDSFDCAFYLKLYPDVANAEIDPEQHFIMHGRKEGRLGSFPRLELVGRFEDFDQSKENILIVSHEASLTGAPILALNLVKELALRYNVVAMILGGGAIENAFACEGVVVVKTPFARGNSFAAELILEFLHQQCKIKFALVNSIESRSVLKGLAKLKVPSISLIHEFAAYTRPKDAFRDAIYWSGGVVFSSEITFENAKTVVPDLNNTVATVLPQGRCIIPRTEVEPERLALDRSRILRAFHPDDMHSNNIVVLGAGFVQLRKGVELFIECAAQIIRTQGGERFRFVWIGNGFDPNLDVQYSVYLDDQISRSGLGKSVVFLNETLAIETAYEKADIFLLPSRLDPLPNVAIDAMVHGLPVLCFNQATGIAEILREGGLAEQCVSEYLNVREMAEKLLVMANSAALRKQVGDRCHSLATEKFNMSSYAECLVRVAEKVEDRAQQEIADINKIVSSQQLNIDFICHSNFEKMDRKQVALRYVRSWASGVGRRKPFPGFHPGIYRETYRSDFYSDPYADYLRAGCPKGQWLQEVITPGKLPMKKYLPNIRIALHLHIFYPSLLDDILERLKINTASPDLFISVPDDNIKVFVTEKLREYNRNVINISVVPNCGRDIGPLLTSFGEVITDGYDIVGHLHTKVSADVKDLSIGNNWYRFLLENLLGGQGGAMADTILGVMACEPEIGLVFPDDPHIVGWGANKVYAERLANRLSLGELPENFNFPVGTMFWARVSTLRPLFELHFDWDDYPVEPLAYDGSLLHAIERILPFLHSTNSRSAVTHVPGVTR